jgi:surface antigen/Ni/Co efflux regulator RcnB
MKRSLMLTAILCAVTSTSALGDPGHGRGHDSWDDRAGPPGLAKKPLGLPPGQAKKMWRMGQRIPRAYVVPEHFVREPWRYQLARPRPGYRWVVVDRDAYLVQVASGVIAQVVADAILDPDGLGAYQYGPPPPAVVAPGDRWRRRYARVYARDDDPFYRDCHQSVDPAGVVGGAVLGGLLGNALGHGSGRAGATIAGVIAGGAVGAALTSHMDCEDRSYAYATYANGFNAGHPGVYRWSNPDNGHYGTFRVEDYYDDPDGFRCANYTQQIYVDGRPQAASGRACQQPDGTWAIVS